MPGNYPFITTAGVLSALTMTPAQLAAAKTDSNAI